MRRAILILGPEASGTRLVTRLFIRAGCFGDDTHEQRLDTMPDGMWPDCFVFRRSIPHNGEYPLIQGMITRLLARGYDVRACVTFREWFANVAAQVANGHAVRTGIAESNIRAAYPWIFEEIEHLIPFVFASYDAITARPAEVVPPLLAAFDLPAVDVSDIFDGNAKHYSL